MKDSPQYTLLGYLNHIALENSTPTGQLVVKEGLETIFLNITGSVLLMNKHTDALLSVEFTPDGPYLDWKRMTVDEWRAYLGHMAKHSEALNARDE